MSTDTLMKALKNLKTEDDVEYVKQATVDETSETFMCPLLALVLSTAVFGISLMMYHWVTTSPNWGSGITYILFVFVTQVIMLLVLFPLLGYENKSKWPVIIGLAQSGIIITITVKILN